MVDDRCVRFLQWALPRSGYRWRGYRKVRRQVCRRVGRRIESLGLAGFDEYATRLRHEPSEWALFDDCCRITISRFHRDRRFWEVLGRQILPGLYRAAAEREPPRLRIWSAGCGAGEEPYTMALLLRLGPSPLPPDLDLEILGTDLDGHQLERARRASYPESSLREVPESWRSLAFEPEPEGEYRLAATFRRGVHLERQDVRAEAPSGRFDLILCRNLIFTYFDVDTRRRCLERLLESLQPSGSLATGTHEDPRVDSPRLTRRPEGACLFTL